MSREEAERLEAMAARFGVPDGVGVEEVRLGGVPGRRVTAPGADPARVLFWLHGGAFTVGSSASYAEMCARLSAASGMAAVCIDYRLSPEHAYPAALDDAAAAWAALSEEPQALALGGDSCGGNLAVALTQRLAREGGRRPDTLYLLSPYLDLTHSGGSIAARDHLDVFVRPEAMPQTAAAYLGETPADEPGVSPLFGEVSGFPPVLTHVGAHEVLYDDAARLHEKLSAAGVPNELTEWKDMPHVFAFFGPMLEEARRATAMAGAWLAQRTGGGG